MVIERTERVPPGSSWQRHPLYEGYGEVWTAGSEEAIEESTQIRPSLGHRRRGADSTTFRRGPPLPRPNEAERPGDVNLESPVSAMHGPSRSDRVAVIGTA